MDTSEILAAIHQGMRKMIFDSAYVFPLDTVVESSVCYKGAMDEEGKWGYRDLPIYHSFAQELQRRKEKIHGDIGNVFRILHLLLVRLSSSTTTARRSGKKRTRKPKEE